MGRNWLGSGPRSRPRSADGRPECLIRSRAAVPSRWRLCDLGVRTFASDLNPVAWFILRCTLHYPRLVGQEERPLPQFALRDREFAEALVKSRGARTKVAIRNALTRLGHEDGQEIQLTSDGLAGGAETRADLAWHLRAWGLRVLGQCSA